MFPRQRHEALLTELRRTGAIRIADMVRLLGVSEVTVRRDIAALADQGLLRREHGGATLPQQLSTRSAETPPVPARAGHRPTLGMVVPSIDYYWPHVVRGAQAATAAAGGRLMFRASNYDAVEDRRQVNHLLTAGVQALLLAPTTTGRAGRDLLRWLGTLRVPVVLLERSAPPSLSLQRLEGVRTDHALGAGLAVRHLAGLGHRRVGLVTTRTSPTSAAIVDGWTEGVTALGLRTSGSFHVEIDPFGAPGWRAAANHLLDTCVRLDTMALLVHSDTEAIGLIQCARDLGLAVPDDLAVVSYDDEVAEAGDPPLTAVRPPKTSIGSTAVELSVARLAAGATRPVFRVTLSPELTVRQSCGARSATAGAGRLPP